MNTLIGFDFSINKPAACLRTSDNKIQFFGWPYKLKENIEKIYTGSNVIIFNRKDEKDKGPDVSSKMRFEVSDALLLSGMIRNTLEPWLNNNTYIGFEGLSFGSKGDVVLQLGGYKYMIMAELSKYVPLENMFTYSPITVKKIAGCSKKGMNKNDIIESFISTSQSNSLKTAMRKDKEKFLKKGGKNFIDMMDDFADAYFVMQTLIEKELS